MKRLADRHETGHATTSPVDPVGGMDDGFESFKANTTTNTTNTDTDTNTNLRF